MSLRQLENGVRLDQSGYITTQELTDQQRSDVRVLWNNVQWLIDDLAEGKKQPNLGEEINKDYGRPCDFCESKSNIWERRRIVKTEFPFLIELVSHYCKQCKGLKRKYFIATNNVLGTSYRADVKD